MGIEITDMKQSEATLRASEDRFRMLFMSMNEGFYLAESIYDDNGTPCDYRYVEVNPAFVQMTGMSRSQIIGRSYRELIPGEPDQGWLKVFSEVTLTGQSTKYTFYSRAYRRHFETIAFSPSPGQFAVLVTDITDRMRSEESLRRLNRTLRAHSNSDQAMVYAKDESHYLQDVCKIVVEDCGHAMVWIGYAEEDEGKTVRPMAYSGFEDGYLETLNITWADTERGRGPTGTAIRTGSPVVCANMQTDPRFAPWRKEAIRRGYAASMAVPLMADCKTFGALTIYSRETDPFSEDELSLLTDLANDLAHGIAMLRLREEHKRAEDALRESEMRLRLFVEHAPVALALFDTHMRYMAVSQRWMRDYDLGENGIIGRSHYDVFPEISEGWKDVYRRCLAGEIQRADEDRFERADGTVQWLRWEALPWRGPNGDIGGIIIFSEDVTERKQNEDAQLFLLQCGLPASGEDFFESLARYLGETLDMDFVCIDRLSGDLLAAQTVAVYFDGKLEDNVAYTLKETPCGDVVGKTICTFHSGVRHLFPHDVVLQDMMAEGYVGTTLWSSQGQPIGLIALISRKPLADSKLAESMLRLVAIRAAGELEREQAEAATAKAHAEAERRAAELESFISNMSDGLMLYDAAGNAILSNQAAREILGVDPRMSLEEWVRKFQLCHFDGTPMKPEEAASARALRGEMIRELRCRLTVPGGEGKVISASSSPVRGADGSVLGVTTIFRDVTGQVALERQKDDLLDREHHIAEVLQQAVLPPESPSEIFGHRIGVCYQAALREAEIGGDFYDVFDLGDGRFGVMIGDVVGKGLGAAIRVAAARHTVRSYAYLDPRPARVLTLANESLCKDVDTESRMLTLFFAVVDPGLSGITYASAGHEPPVLCSADGGCQELEIGGMPVGVMAGISFEQSSCSLHQGDTLVIVTDGITEARVAPLGMYGKDRLIDFVKQHRNESPEDIAAGILEAATSYAGGQLQDDAAVVVLRPGSGTVGQK